MKNLFINFILLVVAILLFFPLTLINLIVVLYKTRNTFFKSLSNYFIDSAINIDKFANHEFRALWNLTLVRQDLLNFHKFGVFEETISYALGKNKQLNTLSKFGKFICKCLDTLNKDHIDRAVKETEARKMEILLN